MGKGTTIGILIAVILLVGGYLWYTNWQTEIMKIPPKAPSDFIAKPISAIKVKLTWDDLPNEQGFQLYRDGVLIAELPQNTNKYEDAKLRPATSYRYEIKAYNQAGESDITACSVKTLNPPIQIWLEKVGVHENGEEGEAFRELWDILRSKQITGEIQVGFVVTDSKNTFKRSIPDKDYFELKQDEVLPVSALLFSTEEVGDYIRLFATAYEQDGGFKEQALYNVLNIATGSYIGMPTSILLKLAGVDFTKIYADIFGAEDDWLGSYVSEWTSADNWGVDTYTDIKCVRENGHVGLRLWFRIKYPVYDYSSEKPASQ